MARRFFWWWMQTETLFASWGRAWPELPLRGKFKKTPEDFVVTELAAHPASDDLPEASKHLYLFLQKRNQTTRELARALADANDLPISSIGYAGMKDKHAVTQQWLSIPLDESGLNGKEPRIPVGAHELQRAMQAKKLRRGWHTGNRFEIVLRELSCALDPSELEARLVLVREQGVPNYFGAQRFGADNLTQAINWLPRRRRERDAFKRGLHLSVLRSFLFNKVLAARVADQSWASVADGPLWGRGRPVVEEATAAFERAALGEDAFIAEELEFAGLRQERRALRLLPQPLSWEFLENDALRLEFVLPPGAYATAVLRELGQQSSAPPAGNLCGSVA